MFAYKANNVNQALQYAIEHLLHEGVEEASRNGSVIVAPGPVLVEYTQPRNRVLYSATRDANHVFHLMESLWMLSGSWDLEFPTFFLKSYGEYSDDGKTMWDAYGHRWRNFFGWDQLNGIVEELAKNPTSRRCVLSMWNSYAQSDFKHPKATEPWSEDFGLAVAGGKAVPCNTHAYFAIRAGKLNMTLMNRSNDAIWGAFGANAVHFSLLLEYMAMRIGVPMGSMYLFTNNLHVYTEKYDRKRLEKIAHECAVAEEQELGPGLAEGFDADLKLFMPWTMALIRAETPATWPAGEKPHYATELASDIPEFQTEFFTHVISPMLLFWVFRKWKDEYSSHICLDGIDAPDWSYAVGQWNDKRTKKMKEKD